MTRTDPTELVARNRLRRFIVERMPERFTFSELLDAWAKAYNYQPASPALASFGRLLRQRLEVLVDEALLDLEPNSRNSAWRVGAGCRPAEVLELRRGRAVVVAKFEPRRSVAA